MEKMDFIKHDLSNFSKKHNIKVVHAKVAKIDGANQNVVLENGEKSLIQKAVVSPGIDFKYEKRLYKREKNMLHML